MPTELPGEGDIGEKTVTELKNDTKYKGVRHCLLPSESLYFGWRAKTVCFYHLANKREIETEKGRREREYERQ